MSDKFVLDMSAFVKKAKGNMDQVVRKVVLDLGVSIVMRSPVGDGSLWKNPPPKGYIGGRFRANWQYAEAVKPSGVLSAIDASGAASISRLNAGVAPEAAGKIHYITNNLPYAMRLETGWSRQAPAGMVGLAVREFAAVVERAASGAR